MTEREMHMAALDRYMADLRKKMKRAEVGDEPHEANAAEGMAGQSMIADESDEDEPKHEPEHGIMIMIEGRPVRRKRDDEDDGY